MTFPLIQSALSAGEISPELYGEVNYQKYSSAATTLRNLFVNYKGGAMSRGGLAFVGRCKQTVSGTGAPRAIPFQFSITQGYVLEFGDQYMRFVFQGGYITEAPVSISGATRAFPCVISVTGSPFSNGDWVFASDVGGMTQLNGNTYIVANATPGSFALKDLNGNYVNASAYSVYTSGGTFSRIYEIETPYDAVDLPFLKYSQSADVMTLTCVNTDTGTEYPPYSLTRVSNTNWTLTEDTFGSDIAKPAGVRVTAQSSSDLTTYYSYVVTAVSAITGEEGIASSVVTVKNNDINVFAGSNTISWNSVIRAGSYNVYKATPSFGVTPPAGLIFGFMANVLGTATVDTNIIPDFSRVPPVHKNPFAEGAITFVGSAANGMGYSQDTIGYTVTTSTGSGFTGTPVAANGKFTGFVIDNGGENYRSSDTITITDTGGGVATGSYAFTSSDPPVDGETVVFNDNTIKYVDKSNTLNKNQIYVQPTVLLAAQELAQFLNASSDVSLNVAAYTVTSTSTDDATVVVTYKTPGTEGNAYTLAAGSYGGTPSGATLTGGGTAGSGAATSLTVGPLTGTYPAVTAYYQQRRVYAASLNNPDTYWMSKPGLFSNMDSSIPVSASDSITGTPWAQQVNSICWLIPMPGGLVVLTGKGAWQVTGGGASAAITPADQTATPQAYNGCNNIVSPVTVNYDIIYLQAKGSIIRDLSYNFFTNIYTGADLTILSSQLFNDFTIDQLVWAEEPYKILWCQRSDGTLLSLTYMKEQNVYGWARHDTQGLVVSITSVTEPPVDALYAITQRFPPSNPQGIYIMERMDDRVWSSVEDAYAVDSAVSNPMTYPDAGITASAASGTGVTFNASEAVFAPANANDILRMAGGIARITGYTNATTVTGDWILNPSLGALLTPYATSGTWSISTPVASLNAPHLAGATVNALADGIPVEGLVVSSTGTITLPFAASNVKAGLPFTAQLQTPYLNGPSPTIQGRRKVIPACTVRIASSGTFKIGTNQPDGAAQNPPQLAPAWSNLAVAQFAEQGATTYSSPAGKTVTQLWTGDIRQLVEGDWKKPGQVAVQQDLPLALEITAVVPEGLEGDLPDVTYAPRQQQQKSPSGPGRFMLEVA